MGEGKRKKNKLNTYSELTSEEMKVAKYVRFNTPKKTTVFQKQNVDYFVGSKAVDALMSSKWTKPMKKEIYAMIQNKSDAVNFMQKMLMNDKLYRVDKVLKEVKPAKQDSSQREKEDASGKVKKRKKGKEENKEKEEKKSKDDQDEKKKEDDGKKADEKKKRKKYKFKLSDDQVFVDSTDSYYVWKFDPMTPKKFFFGVIVVLGIIGVTLFPLWPPEVRVGVYYLSVCGGAFVGSVFVIAAGRSVLFAIVWAVTLGKHHFWLFPNLLADVGVLDSFKPLYTHEVKGDGKKDEDKNSDTEAEEDEKTSSLDDHKAEIDASPKSVLDKASDQTLADQSLQDDAKQSSCNETNLSVDVARDSSSNEIDSQQDNVQEPSDKGSADDRDSTSDYEVIDNATSP